MSLGSMTSISTGGWWVADVSDLPDVGDVRDGVPFGGGSEGTLGLPTAAQVENGVGFGEDDTEFEGTLITTADYPAVGDVRQDVEFDDGGQVGTFAVPSVNSVAKGLRFGAGGTEFEGKYGIPDFSGEVRARKTFSRAIARRGNTISFQQLKPAQPDPDDVYDELTDPYYEDEMLFRAVVVLTPTSEQLAEYGYDEDAAILVVIDALQAEAKYVPTVVDRMTFQGTLYDIRQVKPTGHIQDEIVGYVILGTLKD